MTFTATITHPDEDGYCTIYITGPNYDECHRISCDQASQWAAQEVECLNDPRSYGHDLPESALMDADEQRRAGYAS